MREYGPKLQFWYNRGGCLENTDFEIRGNFECDRRWSRGDKLPAREWLNDCVERSTFTLRQRSQRMGGTNLVWRRTVRKQPPRLYAAFFSQLKLFSSRPQCLENWSVKVPAFGSGRRNLYGKWDRDMCISGWKESDMRMILLGTDQWREVQIRTFTVYNKYMFFFCLWVTWWVLFDVFTGGLCVMMQLCI